jgi:hypothetical protein
MCDDNEKDLAAAEFRLGRVDSNVEFDAAAKLSSDDADAGELVARHAAAAEWRRLLAIRALWGGSEDRARKASSG